MKRILALLALVAMAASCRHGAGIHAPLTPPVTKVPPDLAAPPVLVEYPDLSPLAGKQICLDPGHGGPWPGAVSRGNGLRESDVNLRVALALRDILRDAGAVVVMTREDDTTPVPENMSADLSARPAITARAGSEIFVSIHHNADVHPGSLRNDLEVYYKFGEDGPSLDLAAHLTFALARWLRADAEAKSLLPGNYRVLRDATMPAVLIESSYMSHPENADFLATPVAALAEARAIAAGLALYFASDPPRVGEADLADQGAGLPPVLRMHLGDTQADTTSVRVSLDGVPLDGRAWQDGSWLHWLPAEPLPNGNLALAVTFRSRKGVAARVELPVSVSRPVFVLAARRVPEAFDPASRAEIMIELDVRDREGLPIADGTQVTSSLGTSAVTSGGNARFYAPARAASPALSFRSGGIEATLRPVGGGPALTTIICQDARTSQPVPGAIALADDVSTVANPEGWLALPGPTGPVTVSARGYQPVTLTPKPGHNKVTMSPVHGGALHGKRVVIDPVFGGLQPGPTGPSGLRSSDVSLDVARRVAAMIGEAGATAILTRDGDLNPSELHRLAAADTADLFVSLSFGMPPAQARVLGGDGLFRDDISAFACHYPGSVNGERLARLLAEAFGELHVASSANYLVRQTPCPAVLVQPASIATQAGEERYRHAQHRASAAKAVTNALIHYFIGLAK
jgi:N-acetylmuramoyl-L-alanine amidase